MSDRNIDRFEFPSFSLEDRGPGKFIPRNDAQKNSVIEEDFAGDFEKPETPPDFETQFITERDIKIFLKNAEKEAAEMIENANRQVQRIEREAFEKGFQEGKSVGYQESREEGTKKLLPSVEAFEKVLKELAACRSIIYKNSEAELMELFNAMSMRVIHRELGRSNEFLVDVVREAMKEIAHQEKITVYLNPEDLEYGESFKSSLLAELGNVKSIVMEKDESIARGGCVVETNFGEIDSRVESKIREIEKAILEKKPKKETYKTASEETASGEPPLPE